MRTIRCFAGVLKSSLTIPIDPFERGGRSISDYYGEGSTVAPALRDIELVLDQTRIDDCRISEHIVTDTFRLHEALSELTQNSTIPATAVSNIGVVLADRWDGHPGVWGVMFDYGFNPAGQTAVGSNFTDVPREGCAVFLEPIRAARASESDYHDEVFFTAVHELGHVFNLWHIQHPLSFLSTSDPARVYTDLDGAFRFHPDHVAYLAQCSTSRFVWPGGSAWEVRGMLSPPQGGSLQQAPGASRVPLDLRISMSQREFWHFEPVELDVEIHVWSGVSESFELADNVDPGYPEFRIMIERPNGERYLYRSPEHYCLNPAMVTVGPGMPFQRDISIFGQAGGYTFQEAGVHRLWATYRLPGGQLLRSNELDVRVLPPRPGSEQFRRISAVLTKPRHARFLYYRSGDPSATIVAELEDVAFASTGEHLAPGIHYALGRILGKRASWARRERRVKPDRRETITSQAQRHLSSALDQPSLSPYRRARASSLLRELS